MAGIQFTALSAHQLFSSLFLFFQEKNMGVYYSVANCDLVHSLYQLIPTERYDRLHLLCWNQSAVPLRLANYRFPTTVLRPTRSKWITGNISAVQIDSQILPTSTFNVIKQPKSDPIRSNPIQSDPRRNRNRISAWCSSSVPANDVTDRVSLNYQQADDC